MEKSLIDRGAVEVRFAGVFEHAGLIVAYARRRGSRDPDAVAGEVMTIAWRRLADLPQDDPRPWLIATARNLLLAEHRREPTVIHVEFDAELVPAAAELQAPELDLDPDLAAGLRALSDQEREAILLVAWEDLTPRVAAASLGISSAAFRVRLHRARRRLAQHLADRPSSERLCSPQPTRTFS